MCARVQSVHVMYVTGVCVCTVVAISFDNDKCCVLHSLLVQYLRKKLSHVSIEYIKAHFISF